MSKNNIEQIPLIGKVIKKIIVKKQGGEKTSKLLRDLIDEKYNVEVGMYTYGSCFKSDFNVGGRVVIGKYCSFGPNVHYYGANHPIEHAVMSAYFYNKKFSGLEVEDVPRHKLEIGNDVWVGGNVNIVSSCKYIGNGSVIATGAVVTKSVPPYAIVGGVPAKIIKYRFDKETIDKIEESKWYDLNPNEIMEFYKYIGNPKMFSAAVIKRNKRILYEETR